MVKDMQTDVPNILHAQAWLLIAMFEGQQGIFSRASISFSYSVRAAQMCQLHKLPGNDHYPQESMPPEWWQIEEQRRTWWALFNTDRLLSATTGWPSLIDMNDVGAPSFPSFRASFRKCCQDAELPVFLGLHSLTRLRSFLRGRTT